MTAPAIIELTFDPIMRVGDLEVRAATIALAAVLFVGLLLAAAIGSRTPQASPFVPPPSLRPDDIPFLVLGIAPGALLGGRLEYVLLHLDYYTAHPAAVIDPAQGGLGLALGVLGGLLGGIVIARLVGAPADRWMHAAALPVLFMISAGKLAAVLGAEGQGAPVEVGWATAYHGPGPWGTLAADIPAHPSQVYEAIVAAVVLVAVGLALRAGAFGRRDGSALLAGVVLWAVGRAVVAVTWRDAAVAGPFLAEHLVLAAVVVVCVGGLLRLRRAAQPVGPRRPA